MASPRFDDAAWRAALAFSRRRAGGLAGVDDADDVCQEALLRAWRNASSLREGSSFDAWLATIVANEAHRHHARARPTVALEQFDVADLDPSLGRAELRADVDRAMTELDRDDRLILRLRYEQDLTQGAIARVLDIPEGTVKVRLHRARNRIREVLRSP